MLSGVEGIAFQSTSTRGTSCGTSWCRRSSAPTTRYGGDAGPRSEARPQRVPRSPRQPARDGLRVVLLDRQRRPRRRPRRGCSRVLEGAPRALRVRARSSLVLSGDRALRALNARYRGKDKPTDVLSFPGDGGEAGLGDIVISVETAARNAHAPGAHAAAGARRPGPARLPARARLRPRDGRRRRWTAWRRGCAGGCCGDSRPAQARPAHRAGRWLSLDPGRGRGRLLPGEAPAPQPPRAAATRARRW